MWKTLVRYAILAMLIGVAFVAYKLRPVIEIMSLRKKAETACLCERRQGPTGKQVCWATFEKAIAPKKSIPQIGNNVFCGIVTKAHRDWKDGDRWRQVVTHYLAPGPGGRDVILCTDAEASEVEEAMERDLDGLGRVSAASLKMAEDISLGRPLRAAADGMHCF